jgi:nicotinamide mononucleotide transporter
MDEIVTFLNGIALSVGSLSASRAEVLGALLGVAMIVCNVRVNPMGWPLAALSALMYCLVFWEARLYGDAWLQLLFAAMALWGWQQWLMGRQSDGGKLAVRHLSARGRLYALLAMVVLWPLTGLALHYGTDTDVPWWDAFITAASLVGQWLLARKYVENWPVWVIVNVVAITLFAYKGLGLTVALYAVFLGMAFAGWRAWHRLVPRTAPERLAA